MSKTDLQQYSATDVTNARTKGQIVGWAQGAGTVLTFGLVWSLVGWIPTLVLVGGVVFVGYKLSGK